MMKRIVRGVVVHDHDDVRDPCDRHAGRAAGRLSPHGPRVLTAGRLGALGLILGVVAAAEVQAQGDRLSPGVRQFVAVDAPVVALTGARVVDGTGTAAMSGQTIVITGDRITAIGPSASVDVPEGASVLELEGRTVMPGFVMLHEHMFYPAGRATYTQQEFSFPRLYLAGGTTTIRTGGSRDPYGDLNLQRAIDEGRVPGPRMFVTGPYLNAPGLPILFVNALDGPDDARRMVTYWAGEGATSFKAYMHITRAELSAAIDEAHARNLKVTGHLCSVTFREAADLGIDNLEHGFMASTDFVSGKVADACPSGAARSRSLLDVDMDGPEVRGLISHLVERGVAITSTLPVFEISTPGRPAAPDGALEAMSIQAREQYLRTWARVQQRGEESVESFRRAMAFEYAFAKAGGRLVVGTDPTGYGGVVAGYANQRAVELLVEAGFTPVEAIQLSTESGAQYLDIDDRVGTVEVGKQADLIVVRGDPSTRIEDIRNVELVFKAGIGYDSEKLFDSVRGTVGIH